MYEISIINTVSKDALVAPIKKSIGVETLTIVIMNFNDDGIKDYDKMVSTLASMSTYILAPKKLYLDLKD